MEKENLRKVIDDANQIQIQIKTVEELRKRKLTCYELREFIEKLGGNYEHIRSTLVNSGLIKMERISRSEGSFLYSLADGEIQPRWWRQLISDCRQLIEECQQTVSTITKNNHTLIRLKHQLGKRILRNKRRYKKYKFGSGEYIYDLAYELKVSEATIRDAIKFASKFPDLVTFHKDYESKGENLTWTYIKNNLLYNHKSRKSRKKRQSRK